MPVASASPRPGVQRPLSRELIVDAALSLIERNGVDALSMRRLGAALGVEGMAVYHHFASRDELLEAIAARLFAPLLILELTEDWREASRRFATALRAVALTRPDAFQLVGLKPLDAATSLTAVERLLGVLMAGGLTAPEALAVYRSVASFARGYALAEATGFTIDAAHERGRRRLRSLAHDDFPILAGRVDELAELDADRGFHRGLDALLDGFGKRAEAEPM